MMDKPIITNETLIEKQIMEGDYMSKCPCSDIDETDINLIIEALERDLKFHHHMKINPLYERYYPRLINKLQKWKEAREKPVLEGLK